MYGGSPGGSQKQILEIDAVRSQTPAVYVPRRFRIDGIEGIRPGAAIVGTPQGDGMVAIDVEMEPDVDPHDGLWNRWAVVAAARHLADDEEAARVRQTRLVSEAALVQIGRFAGGQILIDDRASRIELSRWIQAGRADFVVERPFPHQS
jgi:hypothetical protein